MNREEFIGYLASGAEGLAIQLHGRGRLRGLPREFHQALAVAHLLDALGRPAPSSEALRAWYGGEALASPDAARWVYRVVASLRDPDLKKLHPNELNSFALRLVTWGSTASAVAEDMARKLRRARTAAHHRAVNPSKDGESGMTESGQGVQALRHRHTS